MSDALQGGLLATLVAAPVVVACCAGGGVLLAAALAIMSSWFTDPGGVLTLLTFGIAALTIRSIRRARAHCAPPVTANKLGKPATHGT